MAEFILRAPLKGALQDTRAMIILLWWEVKKESVARIIAGLALSKDVEVIVEYCM